MTRPIYGPKRKCGRKPDALRMAMIERFELSYFRKNLNRDLPKHLIEQLENCKSNCARRLLLGISEQLEVA